MPTYNPKTLWIGGSSNLTRTYIHLFGHDDLVLAGREEQAPSWAPKDAKYVPLDLTRTEFDSSLFQNITSLIIGIRSLIWEDQHELLLVGLKAFLDKAAKEGVQYLVHISSVASFDQLGSQKEKSESTSLIEEPCSIFERQSEDIINKYRCFESVHLRIGGIFCDSPTCPNSNAFAFQSRIGPSHSMPVLVDMNSGHNISLAIKLLLENLQQENQVADEYYYTRPIKNKAPMAYGEYLEQYRKAYDITIFLPMPFTLLHMFACFLRRCKIRIGCILALEYITNKHEHTFDCSRFARDFPSIIDREETMYECFKRKRHHKNYKDGE